jgi:hypothetical protein
MVARENVMKSRIFTVTIDPGGYPSPDGAGSRGFTTRNFGADRRVPGDPDIRLLAAL